MAEVDFMRVAKESSRLFDEVFDDRFFRNRIIIPRRDLKSSLSF